MIKPREEHYLYVKMHGIIIPGSDPCIRNISYSVLCSTANRIVIYSGKTVHALVCPLPIPSQRHHIVEVSFLLNISEKIGHRNFRLNCNTSFLFRCFLMVGSLGLMLLNRTTNGLNSSLRINRNTLSWNFYPSKQELIIFHG